MPLLPTAVHALPGTIDATLAGCNCRCATVPRKLSASLGADKSDVLNAFAINRGVIFGSETNSYAVKTSPDGPAVPNDNTDENAYYGDFVISALSHDLTTRRISFTLKTITGSDSVGESTTMLGEGEVGISQFPSMFQANSELGRGLKVRAGFVDGQATSWLGYGDNPASAIGFRKLEIQTGDVVHIRGVTPTAYSGRYVVQRVGPRSYRAYHSSTTQLAVAAALSPLAFTVLRSYPLQPTTAPAGSAAGNPQFSGIYRYREMAAASGTNMLCSHIDDTYARTPVQSIYSNRIHTVSNRYLSKVLDSSFKSETEQSVAVQNSRIITPVPVDVAQIVENRISPTCPLHAPGNLQ